MDKKVEAWTTEEDKKSCKKDQEEILLDLGKGGVKAKIRGFGRNSLTWIHRLITTGTICYLIGTKGWL